MEYAVFKQQIMEQAKRILPQEEGYVITIVDQTEYGLGEMLIINKSDKEVVPGISMEEMYQDFSQNKKSIEVIETIQDTVNTAFMMIPREIDGTQGIDFRDYDCIKDLLVVNWNIMSSTENIYLMEFLKSSLWGHWFCTLDWNRRTS